MHHPLVHGWIFTPHTCCWKCFGGKKLLDHNLRSQGWRFAAKFEETMEKANIFLGGWHLERKSGRQDFPSLNQDWRTTSREFDSFWCGTELSISPKKVTNGSPEAIMASSTGSSISIGADFQLPTVLTSVGWETHHWLPGKSTNEWVDVSPSVLVGGCSSQSF